MTGGLEVCPRLAHASPKCPLTLAFVVDGLGWLPSFSNVMCHRCATTLDSAPSRGDLRHPQAMVGFGDEW